MLPLPGFTQASRTVDDGGALAFTLASTTKTATATSARHARPVRRMTTILMRVSLVDVAPKPKAQSPKPDYLYLFGAPGVGAPLAIGVPAACACVSGAARPIPLPATGEPAACARASGAATVMVAPPRPPVVAVITADS